MKSFLVILAVMFITFGALMFSKVIFSEENKAKRKKGIYPIIIGVIILIIACSFVIIPTGYTGVSSIFGQINETPLPNGFNWVIPFIQNVEKVNNKQQDITYEGQVWSETSEQTVLYMEDVTITYQINPEKSAWIYSHITNYTKNLISPNMVASALKSASRNIATAQATNRGVIEPAAVISIQNAVDDKYGKDVVTIIKVVIDNMDFEDNYNAALEARQIAVLTQEQQAIENETNIKRAEAEAEASRIRAQGTADAQLIEAEAKATANELVSNSITDETLRLDALEKWNGELPKYVGESDTFGILDSAN